MPELPEVETIRQSLSKLIVGKKIQRIELRYPKIVKTDKEYFIQNLINQKIVSIERKGKHLFIVFDKDVLLIHLRMEGRFYLKEKRSIPSKHEHVIFYLTNDQVLTYHDVRKFGTMHVYPKDSYQQIEPYQSIADEPWQQDPSVFFKKIHTKNTEIKGLLLDQRIISGLGNIYVDETLFHARIHPRRKGIDITKDEAKRLIESACYILEKAIQLGGTTIRTFEAMEGIHGRFQNELCVHTKKGQPCLICGHEIQKIKVKGRGTYVCPNCQT
ncbi:MAG: DNA-formamidopyrimidine glycosylase [Acholeplasmataceae bacterium]|jgi:formamidopyrimidine-DNA glycosylase|nr:DNA-formamidopyrimidine glycosylase [Acholeplasmataceae bacterium]